MTRVVLDTNIIIDYLSAKRERHADAVDLIEALLVYGDEPPIVPAGCLKDTYYILCRHYHAEQIVRDRLDDFRHIVHVAELTNDVLDKAFASKGPDIEDDLIAATAELMMADAIITRDTEAYASSTVPSMDAKTFCMQMEV